MRKQLGILLAAIFYYCGLVRFFRWRMQRSGKRLIILNYHRAQGGDLRSHLLYLRRHYRVLPLEEALEELTGPAQKNIHDRRTLLVLTFDDGYHDNYSHALPLACALQIPITLFLVPGYLESGAHFWWNESQRLLQQTRVSTITLNGCRFDLEQAEARKQLEKLIYDRLFHAPSVAEREAFLQEMRRLLAVPNEALAEEQGDLPLTWGEVYKMHESGRVTFGAHTMHHPVLSCLRDATELHYEIETSRQILQQQLGRPIRTFAYPIGKHEHINEAVVQCVRDAGYTWAVTALYGINAPGSDAYLLRRVPGDVSRHWLVMAADISGLWSYLAPLWKSILGE